jgi:ubiquinone/menaquinone biosynthesis C-methylase UbiE
VLLLVDTITLISAVVALFSAVIAFIAERRSRQIEKRIHLAQMLAMYADIGYGNWTNWHPWDIGPNNPHHKEYQQWLIRFFSYDGRVNKEIREDYEYIVKCYAEDPKDEKIKRNDIPTRMKRVREYAHMRVKELGDELGDA